MEYLFCVFLCAVLITRMLCGVEVLSRIFERALQVSKLKAVLRKACEKVRIFVLVARLKRSLIDHFEISNAALSNKVLAWEMPNGNKRH